MENYNFTPENIDDINSQKITFFNLLQEQSKDLIILDNKIIKNLEKTLWTRFIQNHLEIRDDIKLTRHFILKKTSKLNKELKSELYMQEIYGKLLVSTQDAYWNFMLTIFLLFETAHINKNEAIINTVASEIIKTENMSVNSSICIDSEKTDKKIVTRKKQKKPDMLSQMMKNFGDDFGPNGKMDMTKIAEMASKLTNGNKDFDLSKMINNFMPELGEKKNDALMNDMMTDITASMKGMENVDDVFNTTKKLGEKYQQMIVNGDVDPSEILSSLMGLMSNEKFSDELSNIDISKLKPEDMMAKMMGELSPEMMQSMSGLMNGVDGNSADSSANIGKLLSNMTSLVGGSGGNADGELGGLGDLISGLTSGNSEMGLGGLLSGLTGETKQVTTTSTKELTTEQIQEMEEFYINTTIDSVD